MLSVDELSSRVGASPTYMTKLLGRLRRRGLVEAHRGRTGGYALALPASEISLWRVASALEESGRSAQPLTLCSTCPLLEDCPIRSAERAADDHVRAELEGLSVARLAELMDQARAPALETSEEA